MNSFKKAWAFVFILFSFFYIKTVCAVNLSNLLPYQWYWYLHITENRIRLISLVHLDHPEGATNADTSFHFHYPPEPLEAVSSLPITSIIQTNWQHQADKQLAIKSKLFSTLYKTGNDQESKVMGRSSFAEVANPPYFSFILSNILAAFIPPVIPALWLYFRPSIHGTNRILDQHIESGITIGSGLSYPIYDSDSKGHFFNNIRANIGRFFDMREKFHHNSIGNNTEAERTQHEPLDINRLISQMRPLSHVGLFRFNLPGVGNAILWNRRAGGFSGFVSHGLLAQIGFLQGIDLDNPEHMSPERWNHK